MHLVEQLRIKRTEAHNHLFSRKRKLAELFSATACTGEHPTPSTKQRYLQQLQAFQDANDLQKGRLFDVSTLPTRPQITYKPQHVSTQTSPAESLRTSKDLKRSEPPSHSDVAAPNGVPDTNGGSPQRSSGSVHASNGSANSNELFQGRGKNGRLASEGRSHENSVAVHDEASSRMSSSGHSPATHAATSDTHRVDQVNGRAEAKGIQSPHVVAPSTTTEPQSSPTSTNGPDLSNTPAPTTGSTTTSVGGDEPLLEHATTDGGKPTDPKAVPYLPQTPDIDIAPPTHKMSISSVDMDIMDTDPIVAFDSPTQLTSSQTASQREQISRSRPSIKVDTQDPSNKPSKFSGITNAVIVETPAAITATDGSHHLPAATPASAIDGSKRATRISSGALQKKSVSEILGETQKVSTPLIDSPFSSSTRDAFQSATSHARQADRERKEKERTRLSTVVFAKSQRPNTEIDSFEMLGGSSVELEKTTPEERDYLYTLFESKAYSSKQGNLAHLLQHSHKTVTTADHLVDYEYQAQCRVLKRLYQLQSAERWALRQRKRADEPVRQTSHWDFLLDHAKWMRTDFREERKWKLAAARGLAECCAEWVASDPMERKQLQVQVRPTRSHTKHDINTDIAVDEETLEISHPTPELLPSNEDDSVSDDIADPREVTLSAAPAAIFSLGASDFNFVADRTPAFDKLINELPLYEPAKIEPDLAKSNLAEIRDSRWKTDIVAVSRFATEKLKVKEYKPPFKRSRYDYDLETSPPGRNSPLPPRETNVGLFMPENKHIRDRIHPGHSFRPPSEHPMPTQSFFETRISSQWTSAEDDELRKLVKDYSYNWSLISSCLTPRSLYTSSPDRRTPWECFERWIGLEGMPADMAKTPYFRTYSGRIDAATRHLQAQQEEAQRRAGPNVPISYRRKTTTPVRVERKRAQRHLAMLDAMRKLAKKRETLRQKQAHSSEVAAMRKASEINQHNKPPLRTPAEFSALKHEREQKMVKQQELYRQQLIAHQRAASAQQQRGPNGQANGNTNSLPQASNAARPQNNVPVPLPNGHLQVPNGVARPHPTMLGVPNGIPMQGGMVGPKGVQAQMQANLRGGMGGSPQQMRMHQEQLLRQAQQNGNHSSPNGPQASMVNGHNQGFMSDAGGTNGQPSPSTAMANNAGSPRQAGMGQALSSGHVPVLTQIAANIKQRHPNMTDEEVQRAASQQLTTWQQQATAAAAGQASRPRVNQAALNAAMGAANAAAHAGNVAAAAAAAAAQTGGFPHAQGMMTNEQLQQYNQRLRLQQAQQHAARGMQGQMPMPGHMTNSPIMNMSRPVSQHNNQQGMSRSATPRDQRSGSVSNTNAGVTSIANGTAGTTLNGVQGQNGQGQQGSPTRPPSQQTMQT